MAFDNHGFKYVPAFEGDEGLVLSFQEGASQTFLEGHPLILSSGKVVIAAATSFVLNGSQKLIGFAMQDATGTTDAMVKVRVIRPSDLYFVNADPTDTTKTFATANVGSEFGVSFGASLTGGGPYISYDEVTNLFVTLLASGEWTGTGLQASAGGPVYVKFLESVMAGFFEV